MKWKLLKGAAAVGAAFVSLWLASPAQATNGYFSHGYGIKSIGMGGAGIALPQDAIAAAINPAGMAMLGNRIDFGLNYFRPTREAQIVDSPAPFNDTVYKGNETSNFFISEFGYNRMLNSAMSLGVSVYGNGGMNTDYDQPFPLFGSTRPGVDLSQLFVAPTLGYKITPQHAVGVSLNLAAQRFKAHGLENFTAPAFPQQFSAYPDAVTNKGYEWSYGYGLRIGYLGRFSPYLALGLTYQTKTWMTDLDNYKGLFAEEGGFDIPANYGIGITVTPIKDLAIAFDVVRIDYSGIKSINNPLRPLWFDPGGAYLGTSTGSGFGWQDITAYKLGIQYAINPQLTVRGGYNYGKQPIPQSETMFNVLAPGVVEDHWTLGATWTLANKSELSFAFMYAPTVKVDGVNSIPAEFGGGNVNLKMKELSFGVAYGWNF